MTIVTRNERLVIRAYWLTNHRWFAIIALAALTWLGSNLFDITIGEWPLYLLILALIVENLLTLWLLEVITNRKRINLYNSVRLVIHFQIICDLATA